MDGDSEPITRRVFVLNDRMCEVAGMINAAEPLARQLLILHYVEGLDTEALAEAYGLSVDEIGKALAEAEGQFLEILRGLSPGDDGTEPNVRTLLARLAQCISRQFTVVRLESAKDQQRSGIRVGDQLESRVDP